MEIKGLQEELAAFILAEVVTRKEAFSLARSEKLKSQYGLERLARLFVIVMSIDL